MHFKPKKIEIPQDRLMKYQDIWENKSDMDFYHDDKIMAMQERMSKEGVEVFSLLNKDYLGAFHAPFSNNLDAADIVIYGLTLDKCSPVAASHKFGPTAIRNASKTGMGVIHQDGTMPFEMCNIIDYGNWDNLGQFELAAEMEGIQTLVNEMIIDKNCTPLFLGGDHSAAYPAPCALAEIHGPLALIQIDGHFDLLTKSDFPYEYTSGHWFMRLAAEGKLDPESAFQIGMRGRWSYTSRGKANALKTNYYMADEVYKIGIDALAEDILNKIGDGRPVYVTLDLDGLDLLDHSANSSPDPFGLSSRMIYELFMKLRETKRINLVGADISEFAPEKNTNEKDGLIAAAFGWELLTWLAECRYYRNGEKANPTTWPMTFGRNIGF